MGSCQTSRHVFFFRNLVVGVGETTPKITLLQLMHLQEILMGLLNGLIKGTFKDAINIFVGCSILQTALCFVVAVAGDVVVLSKQHFGQSTIYISGQTTESVSLKKSVSL